MMLGELITVLEAEDPAKVCPDGFGRPHSWRGDYFDLAFDPAQNVTVGSMLAAARSAVGATYQGWKGGDYTMDLDSDCYLAEPRDLGETLGPTLLRLMLAAGSVPAPAAEPTEAQPDIPPAMAIADSDGDMWLVCRRCHRRLKSIEDETGLEALALAARQHTCPAQGGEQAVTTR